MTEVTVVILVTAVTVMTLGTVVIEVSVVKGVTVRTELKGLNKKEQN